MMRSYLGLMLLLGPAAMAQNNDWSITRVAGTAVMNDVSALTFRVANASTSRDAIRSFSISIPAAPYDLDGATAPSGWRAATIDRKSRQVTFLALNACGAGAGLPPGSSADFEIRVVGVPLAADAANQTIDTKRTGVTDPCGGALAFRAPTGAWTWTLVGLQGEVTTSLRALDVNDQVTVSLTVTNNSTVAQSGIAPAAPTITGSAAFALVSGPAPSLVNGLAIDGSATFTWIYRATAGGSALFNASATNGTVSSPLNSSLDVNVGVFPASVLVNPRVTVNNGTVTLQVLPTNNTSTALTNVAPMVPTLIATGSAQATQLTGPTPPTVTSLASRSTTAFTTTWRVSGAPGDRITFSGRATATDFNGATLTTSPVSSATVQVQELTITPSPSVVLTGAGATQIAYTVANGSALRITGLVLMTPDATLFSTPTAGTPPAGWTPATTSTRPRGIRFDASTTASYLQPGASQTFIINYTSIGVATSTTPTTHRLHVFYEDLTTGRSGGTVTVAVPRPIPELIIPVAVATTGRVYFSWSNPTLHDGLLILRTLGAVPNTAPAAGRRYPAGTTLGNATVVYEDSMSFATSFADTGLTNGARYYYRLFNRDEYGIYSPGNVPASSPNNYLLSIPPGPAATDAYWCSTVGLPAIQQPFTDLGAAVYQSSNGSFFTSNVITAGAPINGNEKWRPSLTRGVVQARPTAQKLGGATQPSLFVGDQLGYAYRINGATGAIDWTGNGGVALGEVIQAQSVVAMRSFTSTAFQALYPSDVVFFATRNSTVRSSNSVRALRADTGAQLFSYQPGNLDQIAGPPLFDYLGSTLWVASLSTAGPSLRVLNLLTPGAAPLLTISDLGDIPTGVTRQGGVNQALVVDRTGLARGYSLATRAQAWQLNLGGAVSTPLVAYLTDFFASTATGVQRFHIDTVAGTATAVWAAPAAMRLPTSVRIDAVAGKLFVGDADGYLRRLDIATGAIEASVLVSTVGGISMPSLDSTAGLKRLYVGTADGRLCAYPPSF